MRPAKLRFALPLPQQALKTNGNSAPPLCVVPKLRACKKIPPKPKTPRAVTLWRHACLTTPVVKPSPSQSPSVQTTTTPPIVIPEFSFRASGRKISGISAARRACLPIGENAKRCFAGHSATARMKQFCVVPKLRLGMRPAKLRFAQARQLNTPPNPVRFKRDRLRLSLSFFRPLFLLSPNFLVSANSLVLRRCQVLGGEMLGSFFLVFWRFRSTARGRN